MKIFRQQKALIVIVSCVCIFAATLVASSRLRDRDASISNSRKTDARQEGKSIRWIQSQQQGQQLITPQAIGPIDRSVFAGGGGSSSAGSIRVDGTVAEPSASKTMSGGSLTVTGGFWNALPATATPTPTPTPSATPTPTSSPTPTPTPTPTPSPTPTASPTATPTPTPRPNVVQFSSSNYSVVEACTTVTITVNRVGDTSAAASVEYFTADVTASERRDYITAIGTLRFASGEISKSFVVLINDDSFVEGNETFNVNLRNPSGVTLGAPAVATVTIIDNASEQSTNVIDDPSDDVCQHYHDFLNRTPDADGLAFWINQITSCGSDPVCIDLKRINVSAAYFLSIEFQQTGYLVERMYKAAYGDASGTSTIGGMHQLAVPIVRFNEFLPDTQEIGLGVIVGQSGFETVLENNKQAFALEFVQRSRFATALPTSLNPAQFVNQLFANAGVTPSTSDRNAAIAEFGSATNTSDVAARARALRDVAENAILNQQEFNRAFVLMQYIGYLRRNPNDAPDGDYTGYDFWLTKLNAFNGNFVSAEMVKAFITSGEYRQRFGT